MRLASSHAIRVSVALHHLDQRGGGAEQGARLLDHLLGIEDFRGGAQQKGAGGLDLAIGAGGDLGVANSRPPAFTTLRARRSSACRSRGPLSWLSPASDFLIIHD